jgi:hypothetical protein
VTDRAPAAVTGKRVSGHRIADALALVLAIAAVVACLWVAIDVYELIPHIEDEMANLWEAEVMADGRIDLPSPPSPRAFMVPFVIDYQGNRFGKYPPGWPATLSLGVRAGVPWLVNPLLAGLGAWLIYRLGSRVAGKGIGLLAEALAITSPMFLMLSGSLMGHALSLALAAAFWLAWLDLFPRRSHALEKLPASAWMLVTVAGLTLGLLALTRPMTAVGVALPCGIHGLILLFRGGGTERRRVLAVGFVAGALAALLPVWQWILTGDPWLNPYSLWWGYDRIGFGPGIGPTQSGHNLYWAWMNMKFSLRSGLHDLFGWPHLSWLFLPFGLLALRRNRDGWMLFGALPTLLLVHLAYWVGSWLLGPRYYYEALPGVAIASAAGIAWLGGWIGTWGKRWVHLRRLAMTGLVLVLVLLNLIFYTPQRLGGLRGLYGISRDRVHAFEEVAPNRGLVFVHVVYSWTDYGTLLTLTPPFVDSQLILAYSGSEAEDAALARAYPDLPVYYYYADQPDRLYTATR